MGLLVSVYRNSLGDCTNGGISAQASSLCLINVDGPFEPSDRAPGAYLVAGRGHSITPRIIPANAEGEPETCWTMAGGNYAATSDDRFHRAVERLSGSPLNVAIPIHDRIEA